MIQKLNNQELLFKGKNMKKLIFLLILSFSACLFAEDVSRQTVKNDRMLAELLTTKFNLIDDWVNSGTILTFSTNGGTISNATNNAFKFTENSEDIIITFGTNAITLSSSTGVESMVYGAVVPQFTSFKVLEGGSTPTYTTSFTGGDQSGNVAYTLPTADGTNGQSLTTNGSGVLSWTSVDTTFAGGSVTDHIVMANGKYVQSTTTTAHATGLQGYDVDGGAYVNGISVTNGNTVAVAVGAATASFALDSTAVDITTAGAVSGVTDFTASGDVTLGAADKAYALTSTGLNVTNTGVVTGAKRSVLNKTEAYQVVAADSGKVITNAGAGGSVALTLPEAAAGLEYTFVVMAAQDLVLTPAAGDAINIATSQGDAAETFTANAVGEYVTLVAVDGTNWISVANAGTWTQGTP